MRMDVDDARHKVATRRVHNLGAIGHRHISIDSDYFSLGDENGLPGMGGAATGNTGGTHDREVRTGCDGEKARSHPECARHPSHSHPSNPSSKRCTSDGTPLFRCRTTPFWSMINTIGMADTA